MPKLAIEVKGQLDGVSTIEMPEDYPYHLVLRCCSCGEKTEKPVVVSQTDSVEGIRGATVNLKLKCKLCGRTNDLNIIDRHVYKAEHSPGWHPIVTFECRGLEPSDMIFADDVPLIVKGETGFSFEDAYIEDGEFYGYDENKMSEASITEFETRVAKA